MKKTVNIILPVYNVAAYLDRCMNSLINQTYEDKRIILVDDGSTDESGRLCDEYAKRYECVHVLHKANGGVSSARNAGLELALKMGGYIHFVDPDDYIARDCEEKLIAALEETGADMAVCDINYVYEDGLIKPRGHYRQFDKPTVIKDEKLFELVFLKSGVLWNKLFKAEHIQNLRLNENYSIGEDNLFLFQVLLNVGSAVIVPDTLCFYCIRKGSSTKETNLSLQCLDFIDAALECYLLCKVHYPQVREACVGRLMIAIGFAADKVTYQRKHFGLTYEQAKPYLDKIRKSIKITLPSYLRYNSISVNIKTMLFLIFPRGVYRAAGRK